MPRAQPPPIRPSAAASPAMTSPAGSWSPTTIRSAGSWRRTARSRAGSRTRASDALLPAVHEVERQRDREEDHEDHAEDERDAGHRDRRRARALAFRSLVLERLCGFDRMLDRMDDALCLLDRISHV